MTDTLKIELCPETGICSIGRGSTEKVDLMPDEVDALREAGGDAARIKAILAEADSAFAEGLSEEDVNKLAEQFGDRRWMLKHGGILVQGKARWRV